MFAVEQQRDREQQREEGGGEPVGDRPDRVVDRRGVDVEPFGQVVEPVLDLGGRVGVCAGVRR